MMLLVSGSTRTVEGLAASHGDVLGHLVTPRNRNSLDRMEKTGLRWAIDNGCYSGFDRVRFERLARRAAGRPRLLWVVCPDAVGDAGATLELWGEWAPRLRSSGLPVAFVLQDGQEDRELPDADCYFVGGSTPFKLSETAADLGAEAKRRGKWLHMGRVNSLRRIEFAAGMGCDSVDGSSASMFGDKYIGQFCRWMRRTKERPMLF